MSSRLRVAAFVGVLAAVLFAAAFAVAVLRTPREAPIGLPGPPVAIEKAVSPRDPQFGDTVTATVDVAIDSRRVDPGSVRVESSFAPYRVVSSTRDVRRAGNVTVIRVEYRLRCLDAVCTHSGRATMIPLGSLLTAYGRRGRAVTVRSAWPGVRVHTRVLPADLQRPFFRAGPAQRAPTRYRLPPRATGYALLVLATLLALAGGLAVVRGALARTPRRRAIARPLDAVLQELAAASSNGDSGRRRKALEQLARELEPLDEPLSAESRVLAWSPQDPQPETIADLTGRVRTAVGT